MSSSKLMGDRQLWQQGSRAISWDGANCQPSSAGNGSILRAFTGQELRI